MRRRCRVKSRPPIHTKDQVAPTLQNIAKRSVARRQFRFDVRHLLLRFPGQCLLRHTSNVHFFRTFHRNSEEHKLEALRQALIAGENSGDAGELDMEAIRRNARKKESSARILSNSGWRYSHHEAHRAPCVHHVPLQTVLGNPLALAPDTTDNGRRVLFRTMSNQNQVGPQAVGNLAPVKHPHESGRVARHRGDGLRNAEHIRL